MNLLKTYTNEEIIKSIKNVITFTIVDVFNLTEYEQFWLSYHLEEVLSPLQELEAENIAVPVKEELETGKYSKLLNSYKYADARKTPEKVLAASIFEWTQAICTVFSESYKLRPIVSSAITGKITGILEELGIGKRESKYLPNTVRALLNNS